MSRVHESSKKGAPSETLLSVVTEDIYRLNPFKVLGLLTKASLLEAERSAEKLRTMKRLGLKDSNSSEDVSEQEIRDAIECLRDPRKRIVYELFWQDQGPDEK